MIIFIHIWSLPENGKQSTDFVILILANGCIIYWHRTHSKYNICMYKPVCRMSYTYCLLWIEFDLVLINIISFVAQELWAVNLKMIWSFYHKLHIKTGEITVLWYKNINIYIYIYIHNQYSRHRNDVDHTVELDQIPHISLPVLSYEVSRASSLYIFYRNITAPHSMYKQTLKCHGLRPFYFTDTKATVVDLAYTSTLI